MTAEELAERLIGLKIPLTEEEWEGLVDIFETIQPGITAGLNNAVISGGEDEHE